MDAAYNPVLIKQHSQPLGHFPLIDENSRTKKRKAEIEEEQKSRTQKYIRARSCIFTYRQKEMSLTRFKLNPTALKSAQPC
jgi:hypothetical protein